MRSCHGGTGAAGNHLLTYLHVQRLRGLMRKESFAFRTFAVCLARWNTLHKPVCHR